MSLTGKLRKAVRVLRDEGPAALWRLTVKRLRPAPAEVRPNESAMAFEVLRARHTTGSMVDVGAHIGDSLRPFVRHGWKVLAFEPDSANRHRLAQQFGSLENVTIDPRAVSDHAEQGATLYRSPESDGISGLAAFHSSHQAAETVAVTTLEVVFNERGISVVDFLKVDTEGLDLFVLRGLPWGKVVPRMVLCEFEDAKTIPLGYSFHDLTRFLVERGYRIVVSEWYPIVQYGQSHDWRRFHPYPCELMDPAAWGNIFAVRDDRLYRRLLKHCEKTSKRIRKALRR